MVLVGGLFLVLTAVMFGSLFVPAAKPGIHGAFWFLAKVLTYLYGFLWFRFTFPRYRFDQLMRLGWQFLIPLALTNVMGVGIAQILRQQLGWNAFAAFGLTLLATIGVAAWLITLNDRRDRDQAAAAAALVGGD
jgi:hypothetical protein